MDFVFRFLRKTVAPASLAESASKTLPITTRWPMFCACAIGGPTNPLYDPNGTKPAAKAAIATPATKIVRLTLTLPPLPLQTVRHRPHPDRRRPASTPAVQHQRLRIPIHIRRRRAHRLLPPHPIRRQDHFRIQGSSSSQHLLLPRQFSV